MIAAPLAASAQTQVDLQLVLAVDASGSVSEARFELQKRGYVAAFRNPRLLHAVQSGPTQSIAVTMMQWTGPALQVHVVPWMIVRDQASMQRVADAIDAAPRRLFGGGTSISGAIDHARTLFPVPTIAVGPPTRHAMMRSPTASSSTVCRFSRSSLGSTNTTSPM
jgi:hypothetical protein